MKKITNEISASAKKSLLTRTITAIVLAALAVPAIIVGGWFFFFFSLVVTILSAFEIVRVSNIKGLLKVLIYFITIVITLGIIYYSMYEQNVDALKSGGNKALVDVNFLVNSFVGTVDTATKTSRLTGINLSIMLVTLMLCIYFLISFTVEAFNIAYVFYFSTMVVVVSIGIQSLLFLRYAPFYFVKTDLMDKAIFVDNVVKTNGFKYGQSMFLLLYVILGVIFNDMGAYFVGMFFGKHKMNERISPKKTWEGFIGGVVFSIIVSSLFALFCAIGDKPILPMFDLSHLYYVIIISILIPLISDVGDFVFSAVKRTFGVKDFSNLLPGHGGILDRIDSLLFAAALVACLIIFIATVNVRGTANGVISA